MKRRFILASSSALLLTGCALTPVRNWQIETINGPLKGGTGVRVSVRSIGLPSALNQPGVPQPGPANAANSFSNDLWAAPLASMLQITMVADLAQRLPNDVVLADGGAIGAQPDLYVEIQILDFSPDSAGVVTLKAQIATRPVNSQTWNLQQFRQDAPGGNQAATITACMSQLWGQLADHIAPMLV